MSLWRTIKNAFIPWRLLDRSDDGSAIGSARFGQMLIDGTSGDVVGELAHPPTGVTRPVPPTTTPYQPANNLQQNRPLARFR